MYGCGGACRACAVRTRCVLRRRSPATSRGHCVCVCVCVCVPTTHSPAQAVGVQLARRAAAGAGAGCEGGGGRARCAGGGGRRCASPCVRDRRAEGERRALELPALAPWSFARKVDAFGNSFPREKLPSCAVGAHAQASLAHSVSARRRRSMFVFTSPSSSPRLSTSGAGALRTRRRGAVAT